MYSDKLDKLKKVKNSDLEYFNLNERIVCGKVVDILDANSCCVIFLLDSLVFKFNCKLNNTKINKNSNKSNLFKLVTDIEKYSPDINISENNTKILKIKLNNFNKDGFLLVDFLELNSDIIINKILIDDKKLSKYDCSKNMFKFNN